MTGADGVDFVVRKKDWSEFRFVPAAVPDELESGQVLFRVDRFAFTANNISYALAGDMLNYWSFFPTEEGWGRLPVMGFGDVVASNHPDVAAGGRYFGFYPMSRHLVVEAKPVPAGLFDTAAHREETAPAYRQYAETTVDPMYQEKYEDELMLLRGLFLTSFLVDDFLAEDDFFGAETFVVGSASSKTAIALAHLLSARGRGEVVGLTSPRNRAFVEGLDCYDRAVLYDDVETLAKRPTVFVDMAGNGPVTNRLHHHLGDDVKYSCSVGATHWDAGGRDENLPGAAPTFFFAPGQIQKRSAEWGPEGLQERLGGALAGFLDASGSWLHVVRGAGRDAVERVYRETLEGRTDPAQGHVLTLWD